MNLLQQKLYTLIQKYETRLEAKKQQLRLNPNDCTEGIIIALEEVMAELKEIALVVPPPTAVEALVALLDDHKRMFTEVHPHSTIDWSECEEVKAAQAAINNITSK